MSASKKKPAKAKRQGRERVQSASFVELDIQSEIRYIIKLAQAEDSRIVALGDFVLFSTRTRDAWLLDPTDDLAACVCRDGEPQPLTIIDTPTQFGIDWPAKFDTRGETFVVYERSGRVVEIVGYPTAQIAAACGR